MTRDEILKRVRTVTATILNIDEAECAEDKSFTADLGAESIQSVELMAGFNAEFDIEMDEDGALECETIGSAVDFIAPYVSGK
ncbi:phosphopantetheine-binding protein [bacterium]|nr:phosphopantetheine-binding protein [bacterium]